MNDYGALKLNDIDGAETCIITKAGRRRLVDIKMWVWIGIVN